MSILKFFEAEGVWILDHSGHILNTYGDVNLRSKDLFDVRTPFYMDLQAMRIAEEVEAGETRPRRKKKRKKDSCQSFEANFVRKKFEKVRGLFEQVFDPPPSADVIRENNRTLRKMVSDLTGSDKFVRMPTRSGFNDSATSKLSKIGDVEFVNPPKSRFYVDDLINFRSDKKFDVILMDPPWENKHVKRVNHRGEGYDVLPTNSMSALLVSML